MTKPYYLFYDLLLEHILLVCTFISLLNIKCHFSVVFFYIKFLYVYVYIKRSLVTYTCMYFQK